jgi:hypothetical protein
MLFIIIKKKGHMIQQEQFTKTCQKYFSTWTFLEAYHRTGNI